MVLIDLDNKLSIVRIVVSWSFRCLWCFWSSPTFTVANRFQTCSKRRSLDQMFRPTGSQYTTNMIVSTPTQFQFSKGMSSRCIVHNQLAVSPNHKYTLLTDEDVVAMSADRVISRHKLTIRRDERGRRQDVNGGVYDPRLGPVDANAVCATCMCTIEECPGHMGRIELAAPMLLLDSPTGPWSSMIKRVLRGCCFTCKCLVKSGGCTTCGRRVKRLVLLGEDTGCIRGVQIEYFGDLRATADVSIEETRSLLRIVEGDETHSLFGCRNPSALVRQMLVVAPPAHRMDKVTGSVRQRDKYSGAYTQTYLEILRANYTLGVFRGLLQLANQTDGRAALKLQMRDVFGMSMQQLDHKIATCSRHYIDMTIDNATGQLRRHATALLNGYKPGSSHTSACSVANFPGVYSIIGGSKGNPKDGLFRHDALGKKIENVVRAVITGMGELPHDTVAVPSKLAHQLCATEFVTRFNASAVLKEFVGGNPRIFRIEFVDMGQPTGRKRQQPIAWRKQVAGEDRQLVVDMLQQLIHHGRVRNRRGLIVMHRALASGDWLLANRNPTIHRPNIQAMRARVLDGCEDNCISLNCEGAEMFKMDFDGDMMKIFPPTDIWAKAEAIVLQSTTTLLVDANGRVVMQPGPNTVLGWHGLTDPTLWLLEPQFGVAFVQLAISALLPRDREHLSDPCNHIDHGCWATRNDDDPVCRTDTIAQTNNPTMQCAKMLLEACLPVGFEIDLSVDSPSPPCSDRSRNFVATGRVPAEHLHRLLREAGATFACIQEDAKGMALYGYCEHDSPAAAIGGIECVAIGLPPVGVRDRAAHLLARGWGEPRPRPKCMLRVRDGRVVGALPQLGKAALNAILHQVLHFAHPSSVLASMACLQRVGNAFLEARLCCCSPEQLWGAVKGGGMPQPFALGVVVTKAVAADVPGGIRSCVDSGAKGKPKDVASMVVQVGALPGDVFAGGEEGAVIPESYMTGMSQESKMRVQRIGVYQDLKTKTEIGEIGYRSRELMLAAAKATAGMAGEVRIVEGKGRDRLVQVCYGGDGFDPHKLNRLPASSPTVEGLPPRLGGWGSDLSAYVEAAAHALRLSVPNIPAMCDELSADVPLSLALDHASYLSGPADEAWRTTVGHALVAGGVAVADTGRRHGASRVEVLLVAMGGDAGGDDRFAHIDLATIVKRLADWDTSKYVLVSRANFCTDFGLVCETLEEFEFLFAGGDASEDTLQQAVGFGQPLRRRLWELFHEKLQRQSCGYRHNNTVRQLATRCKYLVCASLPGFNVLQGLALLCIVMKRQHYCRVEYGAPVGAHAVEALSMDLQQAALQLKHGASGVDSKTRFAQLVELVYPHTFGVTVRGGNIRIRPSECFQSCMQCVEKVYVLDTFTGGSPCAGDVVSADTDGFAAGVGYKFVPHGGDDVVMALRCALRKLSKAAPAGAVVLHTELDAGGISFLLVHNPRAKRCAVDDFGVGKDASQLAQHLLSLGGSTCAQVEQRCREVFGGRQEDVAALVEQALLERGTMESDLGRYNAWLEKCVGALLRRRVASTGPEITSVLPQGADSVVVTMTNPNKRGHSQTSVLVQAATAFGTTLAHDDATQIDCRDPCITQEVWGVEGARAVLVQELELLFAGTQPDPRHIYLLADMLTMQGEVCGVRRSDVATSRTPLELAAFERPRGALTTAAAAGVECEENSVYSCCMYNRPARVGTGAIAISDTLNPLAPRDGTLGTVWVPPPSGPSRGGPQTAPSTAEKAAMFADLNSLGLIM